MSITSYASNSSSSILTEFPDDLLLKITCCNLQNESPYKQFITLYDLSLVRQSLKLKVESSWIDFIRLIGQFPQLEAAYPGVDFKKQTPESIEKARNFFVQRAINWKKATPIVSSKPIFLQNCTQLCIPNNHLGMPELWAIDNEHLNLFQIDPITKVSTKYPLTARSNPVTTPHPRNPYMCSWMASSAKWVALCTFPHQWARKNEISIIETSSGNRCHKIPTLEFYHFCFEDEYLYVLGKDSEKKSILLKYDCNNWKTDPQKLCLEGDVITFYPCRQGLLFIHEYIKPHYGCTKWKALLLKKEDCFSNSTPYFIEIPQELDSPAITILDDEFLYLSSEYQNEQHYAVLKSFRLENGSFTEKYCKNFPIKNDFPVADFTVLFDRFITHKYTCVIHKDNIVESAVSLFDHTNQNHITDFDAKTPSFPEYDSLRYMVRLPNKNIQMIYSSRNPQTDELAIDIMELDFQI